MHQHDSDRLAATITEAAKTINSPRSLEETLDAIAHAARDTIPGFDHVGISISHQGGSIETKAGTDQLVWELDALQYELMQGPCVDAIRQGPVMVMEDIDHERRWPEYTHKASQKGLLSQMGLRLYLEDHTLGGLNLYSTQARGLDPDALQIAELFATHAAIALERSRYEHDLNEAVASRQSIGTAVGIIMERYRITEDRAFQFLARASMTSNIKLREIADEVLASTNDRYDHQSD